MKLVVHPGEILAEELQELGITATELARQLRVPANRMSQIIQGKRSITGDTALRLGHWFQNSPQFWLNLQTNYELRLAEQQAGAEIALLPTSSFSSSSQEASFTPLVQIAHTDPV